MREELKLCPFCGKPPTVSNGHIEKLPHFKITCHAEVGCVGSGGDKIVRDMWNSAYCWKELEKKDAEIALLKSQLKELMGEK